MAIVFLDTETTGLGLDDDIWEFGAVRREADGTETETHLFIEHNVFKCKGLPEPFLSDHDARFPEDGSAAEPDSAARIISELFTDRPHVVGAVPNFDTERLALLLRRFGIEPGWHYHLIDVENLAVGYLAGRAAQSEFDAGWATPGLPWDSDELSRAVGVESTRFGRHTAVGDVRWAMAIYDAIMGPA